MIIKLLQYVVEVSFTIEVVKLTMFFSILQHGKYIVDDIENMKF